MDAIYLGIVVAFFALCVSAWSGSSSAFRRQAMDVIHLVGAVVSALLFIYLAVALLKPEWFS